MGEATPSLTAACHVTGQCPRSPSHAMNRPDIRPTATKGTGTPPPPCSMARVNRYTVSKTVSATIEHPVSTFQTMIRSFRAWLATMMPASSGSTPASTRRRVVSSGESFAFKSSPAHRCGSSGLSSITGRFPICRRRSSISAAQPNRHPGVEAAARSAEHRARPDHRRWYKGQLFRGPAGSAQRHARTRRCIAPVETPTAVCVESLAWVVGSAEIENSATLPPRVGPRQICAGEACVS